MVEIQCVACEKAIKPWQLNDTDNYDTENYDGQIVCQECKSLLHVKLVKGKVQKYKIVESKFKDSNSLNWIDLIGSAQEAIKQHGKADREGTKQ